MTFKHSGDLGDIVFSLPAIRALIERQAGEGAGGGSGGSGGTVLYLDPEGGKAEPEVRRTILRGHTRLNPQSIESLRPLLLKQPYIQDVRLWQGEPVDHNLDAHRSQSGKNLCEFHLNLFNLPATEADRAWLTNIEPLADEAHPFVVSRSLRYTSNYDFWLRSLPQMVDRAVFVGHPFEHQAFEYTFGYPIQYRPTETILDLAQVIAGCRQFIGNASLPHAIAEGMKKKLIAEVYRVAPRIVFEREAQNMFDAIAARG